MDKSQSKDGKPERERRLDPELLKKGLRCDLDQYEMLKCCSDKKDMTEWNQWREIHEKEDILLEGAYLSEAYLKGANLGTLQLLDGETDAPLLGEVYLKGANLEVSQLEGADLQFAHLEYTCLMWACLEDTKLMDADLRNAVLQWAHLEKSDVAHAHLEGAIFEQATVDGLTSLWQCSIDRKTNFLGVSLDVAKIDPGTKQLLEYNIRRMNWEEWYKGHCLLRWPVRWFWSISDYGLRTWRIIGWFLGLAFVFAGIYYLCALMNPPGIVNSLIEGKEGLVPAWLLPFRSIYFSIVTMTTLGFGDMHANCQSFWGHLLLTFQVILGYVLLGALVTRFAVLFTAGGPAGKFADEQSVSDRLSRLWARIKGKDAKRP